MWQEPNCDMDLEVYKDWLYEFNNNDDLRLINFWIFCNNNSGMDYHAFYEDIKARGGGEGGWAIIGTTGKMFIGSNKSSQGSPPDLFEHCFFMESFMLHGCGINYGD